MFKMKNVCKMYYLKTIFVVLLSGLIDDYMFLQKNTN